MSVVFEGVICISDVGTLREAIAEFAAKHPVTTFAVGKIDNELSVVFGMDDGQRRFQDEHIYLAEELSVSLGRSLLIRYDGRCDADAAYCYEDGKVVAGYDEEDEVWALVDDNYNIIQDGPRYTRAELQELPDDVERDCVTDAIDYGLEALGKGDRKTVWKFMTNPVVAV